MQSYFEVTFPLTLKSENSFSITFTSQNGGTLKFDRGIYYLIGDNGSGKTTFLNMLALIAGPIGKSASRNKGTIYFNGEAYNEKDFNYIRAAEIREKYFCIFPQKAFFLPVSSRDNYLVLNGSDKSRARSLSPRQYPDFLSGGQQQKILMDIILDEKKPVWFLDEPLSNLDAERRQYFWTTLERASEKELNTIFFIDHWMGQEISNDLDFERIESVGVVMEYRQKNLTPEIEKRKISIYKNSSPGQFFGRQINKEKTDAARRNDQRISV